jgi:hypothetical protein
MARIVSELTEGFKNGPAANLSMTKNRTIKERERDDTNLSLVGDPFGGKKP